jgi:hypothetical protein
MFPISLGRLAAALTLSFTVSASSDAADQILPCGTGAQYPAIVGWEKMPDGMKLGIVSGVFPDPDGEHLWILARCGANLCAGSDQDPIMKFNLDGDMVDSFGGRLRAWPHGFWLDHDGNLWVTEGAPAGDRRGAAGAALGLGHQVLKFNQQGEVLMRLGIAGEPGDDHAHFNGPAGVAVDSNGDIWVADGHRGGNNRLMRFAADGTFKMQIGGGIDSASDKPGLFNDPHHISFDSRGRIFVSDRGNNRLQLFDSEGNFLSIWTHFGRPSGIYIDPDDKFFVTDGMSDEEKNPGWQKGVRIGKATTGEALYTILDLHNYVRGQSGIEFLATDAAGNIYGGEVTNQALVKFVRQ